ncbi:sulfhydryl oxidase 2-like [Vespa mandarinia]|uniref:sulfhydryl oxidase 2-like n=1 Tax=Vespa mandarinia TaxID=7446 RepID=UPI00160FF819|nr:sulfhydryl oxidase 2-like [Vespa mandarinia]
MQRNDFITKIILLYIVIICKYVTVVAIQDDQYQSYPAQGLYNTSDNVVVLNATNFKTSVYGDSKGWLVEFYNSWCGFCYRFAPTWKAFASDVYSWRDIVVIAAIDCAVDDNNPICREYEIMHYPTLKYFPVNSHSSFMGIVVEKGDNVDDVRHNLIKRLEKEQEEGRGITWPNITPYRNAEIKDIWKVVPKTVKYFFLLFEKTDSHMGTEVILDMHKISSLQIRRVISDNELLCVTSKITKFPSLIVMGQKEPQKLLNIRIPTREGIIQTIKNYMNSKGINIDEQIIGNYNGELLTQKSNTINDTKSNSLQKQQYNSGTFEDHLYQLDLENALRYSIYHEVPMTKIIEGEKMEALKLYLNAIAKYFPMRYSSIFLDVIRDVINKKEKISGEEFIRLVRSTEEEMSPVYSGPQQWIGCKGSKETYRGYPCGLWTMFHMLTVNFGMENKDKTHYNPIEVLRAMYGYIKNFFGCADCSRHFVEMASRNKIFEVQNGDDNILWLWKAHNEVNARLAGDETEDPEHKKIQYPSQDHCSECRYLNQTWNEAQVLYYLKRKYSYAGINYYGSSEKQSNVKNGGSKMRQERLASNKYISLKKLGWDFTVFDISICVVLYVTSATILTLVCIKFAVKRTYRKKAYLNLLGKV